MPSGRNRLLRAGIPVGNQSVLLKGVNDNAQTLIELMRTLVENRIKPYYLHHPDLAPGTGHFRVSIKKGRDIVRAMRAALDGYKPSPRNAFRARRRDARTVPCRVATSSTTCAPDGRRLENASTPRA